jgi:hypothetical protein
MHPIKIPMIFCTDIEKSILSQVPVVHNYNPSYSGGRHQEDRDLKPVSGK